MAAAVALMIVAFYYAGAVRAPLVTFIGAGEVDIVDAVPVGGQAWQSGVRPGQVVDGYLPYGTGFRLVIDGRGVEVNEEQPALDGAPWLLAVAATMVAVASRAFGFPGAALLLVLGVSMATRPLLGESVMPAAAAVLPLPLLVAALAFDGFPRRAARIVRAGARGLVAVAVGIAVFAGSELAWQQVWDWPMVAAIALVLAGAAASGLRESRLWLRQPSARRSFSDLVVALAPGFRRVYERGRDAERERLSSTVHDELLPRIQRSMRALDPDEPSTVPLALELHAMEKDLRRLMNERQTVILRAGGIVAGLGSLLATTRPTTNCYVEDRLDPSDVRYPPDVELTAYRIAVEALNNAAGHAQANEIVVTVAGSRDHLELTVRDDGHGISGEPVGRPGHVGLALMQARATDAGGQLDIRQRPEGGTEVRFRWPR